MVQDSSPMSMLPKRAEGEWEMLLWANQAADRAWRCLSIRQVSAVTDSSLLLAGNPRDHVREQEAARLTCISQEHEVSYMESATMEAYFGLRARLSVWAGSKMVRPTGNDVPKHLVDLQYIPFVFRSPRWSGAAISSSSVSPKIQT